jgi:hypothetical protein
MSGPTRRLLGPLRHNIERLIAASPKFSNVFNSYDERELFLIELLRFEEKASRYLIQFTELRNKLLDFAQNNEEDARKTEEDADGYAQASSALTDALGDVKANITFIRSQKSDEEEQRKTNGLIAATTAAANLVSATPSPVANTTSSAGMKLYKLEPKLFAGDVMEWCAWWDWFNAAVHKHPKLSTIEKMNHLFSLLTGEAAESVKGIALTEANYVATIDKLTSRFGKPEIVVGALYDAITNLSSATNTTTGIRKFVDKLESHLQQLISLNEKIGDNKYLLTVIQSKLPQAIRIKLDERRTNAAALWTVATYRTALFDYLTAQETYELQFRMSINAISNPTSTPLDDDRKQVSFITRTTAEALYTSDRTPTDQPRKRESKWNKTTKPPPKCAFCGIKDHYSNACTKYTTVETRKGQMHNRCYQCLGKDHKSNNCQRSKPCWYCKQHGHHQSLCPTQFGTSSSSNVAVSSITETTNAYTSDDTSLLACGENVLLATATVEVSSTTSLKVAKVRLLFDSGSQRSYITAKLASSLQLKQTSTISLSLSTFGSTMPKQVESAVVPLRIKLIDGTYFTIAANVTPTITSGISRAVLSEKITTSLCRIVLADTLPTRDDTVQIDLLCGCDYYHDFVLCTKYEIATGLYCIDTTVGWIIQGRHSTESMNASTLTCPTSTFLAHSTLDLQGNLTLTKADDCLLHKFEPAIMWNLETIGIVDKSDNTDDDIAQTMFNDTIEFTDGRYYVKWPWKTSNPQIPTNYELSLGRLNSLLRRYKNSPDVLKQYQTTLDNQEKQGIIEKVDTDISSTPKHYPPHHAVITPDKNTTKLRIVYDGSAKCRKGNLSINDCLYRGPVNIDDVCSHLIQFRLHKIAIVADIEKAFLQIGLKETDRDVTRFLWLKNTSKLSTEDNIQIYRFARIPFGIISSPFLLTATIEHHLRHEGSEIALHILNNIYVDNIITGVSTEREAIRFYERAKEIFAKASMNVREWSSNCKEFIRQLPVCDKTTGAIVKVLGITWDTQADTLQIHSTSLESINNVTKRHVLKVLASYFDPLGIVSPTLLLAKLFLKKLWSEKYSWDAELGTELSTEWGDIMKAVKPIAHTAFPRHINLQIQHTTVFYELHCFCDASGKAYGACVYLLIVTPQEKTCHLVFAKSRVAPIKSISLPRLELTAVYIGSRILKYVAQNLRMPIKRMYVWTDSQCTLHWLISTKPLPVFIRNRVDTILQLPNVKFQYVPTKENPADLASRGLAAEDLFASSLWWHGPHWLTDSNASWPSQEFLKYEEKLSETLLINVEDDLNSQRFTTPFNIKSEDYSSLKHLLRITALCYRVVTRIKDKPKSSLIPSEINQAKTNWIMFIQQQTFSDVFEALEQNGKHSLMQLELFLDKDAILRCNGRLSNAELSQQAIHPILLPKDNSFTRLIIKDFHERLKHVGTAHALASIRNEYWIPAGRATVAKCLRSCITCKKYDGAPYRMPRMADYPTSRVTSSQPFTSTGLDYLGPLYIRTKDGEQKVWICLFTCLSIRAVHLELIDDMTANEFLFCLRRFIAKRGKPSLIISDNALQFKSVSSVTGLIWKNVVDDPSVVSYTSNEGIHWSFITDRAPWMGGVYERLVRLVKQSLRKSIQKRKLTRVELATLVDEVTAIINFRPLVYVGAEFKSGILLTPSHFLMPNVKNGTPDVNIDDFRDPYLRRSDVVQRTTH